MLPGHQGSLHTYMVWSQDCCIPCWGLGTQGIMAPDSQASPRQASFFKGLSLCIISYCCSNKFPQHGWLKIMEICSLIILEASSQRSVSVDESQGIDWQDWLLLEALGETLFPCIFQVLVEICMPWFVTPSSTFKAHHSILCFCRHIAFSSVVESPSASPSACL